MKLHRVVGKIPALLKGFTVDELVALPMPSPFRKVIVNLASGS